MKGLIRKIFFLLLWVIILNNVAVFANNSHIITDYHQTFFPCYKVKDATMRIAIRMYYQDNIPYYLVVDPASFSTEAAPATTFKPRKTINNVPVPGYFTMRELLETPYMKALMQYTSPPYKSENYGITQANHPVNAVFLTVDMCPSVKPFEVNFFNKLVTISEKLHQPTPVALSITGLWIIGHPKEFNWLMKQERENKLKITWINHSFSHAYYADLPMIQNFLVIPQTNARHEILATEKLLLENNQLPSVYFRFPGLISNKQLVVKLRKYGLIPIGSNAWLAHNQEVNIGSFILVHGNSNEPEGIQKVMLLLQNSTYHFLSLSDAFSK
jgi:peptidoglycan/xylan/chitin deacetylase (PgdA/CDA1 family)